MKKKALIVIKSCNRRDLELDHVKNYLIGNGYSVDEIEARQFIKLQKNSFNNDADLIIFSTCAALNATEESAIQDLQMIQQNKKAGAEVIVCGCLPEINPDRLSSVFNGASFGPRSYEKLNEIIKSEKKFQEYSHQNKTRAYGGDTFAIQIHEGCPNNCSYCAIKFSIGGLKSKPINDVMNEFRQGIGQGYKKFVFLGDCLGAYGLDINDNFGKLLKKVLEVDEDYSLSLLDIAPFYLPLFYNEIKMLCHMGKITSLYVAVQSANSRILRLMRRSFDMNHAKDMLIELKNGNSSFELITSIIVGFPSETMEELNDTIKFCKEVGFNTIYCHGYSVRPNVDSAKFQGQLSSEEIKERCLFVESQLGDSVVIMTFPGDGATVRTISGKWSQTN